MKRNTPRVKAQLPSLIFYSELPAEYQNFPKEQAKPMITNWEWIIEKGLEYDCFMQSGSILTLYKDKPLLSNGPHKIGDNWPSDNFIPVAHVQIKRVPYYTVIYLAKIADAPVVRCGSIALDTDIKIEVTGHIVKVDYDDVAIYVGPDRLQN